MATDGLEVSKIKGEKSGMYVFTTVSVKFTSGGVPTPIDEETTLELRVENGKFVDKIIADGEPTTDLGGNEDEINPGITDNCEIKNLPIGTLEVGFKVKGFNDMINETILTVKDRNSEVIEVRRWYDDKLW